MSFHTHAIRQYSSESLGRAPLRCSSLLLATLLLISMNACGGGGDQPGGTTGPGPGGSPSVTVASGGNVVVSAGASANTSISIGRAGGYTGAVTLSVNGLPSTVTVAISPTLLDANTTSASLTFTAVASATATTQAITVRATGSGVSDATTTLQLSVTAAVAVASAIVVTQGDAQSVVAGAPVPVAPRVVVRDQNAQPMPGIAVTFAVDTGAALLTDSISVTGPDGTATLGSLRPSPGRAVVRVTAGSLQPARIVATGTGVLSVGSGSVPTTGGTFTVSRPGDRLDGMQVQIPSSAYATSTSLAISYADDAMPSSVSNKVKQIAPVIRILSSSGDYTTGAPMMIKIPVKLTPNNWPVAIMYDPATGAAQAVPVVPDGNGAVSVATRHLNGASVGPPTATSSYTGSRTLTGKAHARADLPTAVYLIIGTVTYSSMLEDLDTGYQPAVDDWEFDQYVMDISPAARANNFFSLTSAWYFDKYKRGGAPSLNKRFQKAQGVEYSNRDGIRLGADVGIRSNLGAILIYNFALADVVIRNPGLTLDSLILLQVKSAIVALNKPQLFAVSTGSGPDGGLAFLLAYRSHANSIDVSLGTAASGINSPRTITHANGKMIATVWGPRDLASDGFETRTENSYYAVGLTASVPGAVLDAAWSKVLNGTSGDDYAHKVDVVTREQPKAENNTIWIADDTTRVWFECMFCPYTYPAGPNVPAQNSVVGARFFQRNGGTWSKHQTEVVLGSGFKLTAQQEGNHYGFAFFEKSGQSDNFGVYLDWKEFDVKVRRLAVSPDLPTVSYGQTFTLTATQEGALPPTPSWEWSLGDERKIVTQVNKIDVSYTAPPGQTGDKTYDIKVQLRTDGKPYATGKTKAKIGSGPHWMLTSITDTDHFFQAFEEISFPAMERALAVPNAAMISLDATSTGADLNFRVRKTGTWQGAPCCPPPVVDENKIPIGRTPKITYAFGPAFAGWETNFTQSTTNLDEGTMTSSLVDGTTTYTPVGSAAQLGPNVGWRLTEVVRNGATMTGTLTLSAWELENEDRVIDEKKWRFKFTATRLGVAASPAPLRR